MILQSPTPPPKSPSQVKQMAGGGGWKSGASGESEGMFEKAAWQLSDLQLFHFWVKPHRKKDVFQAKLEVAKSQRLQVICCC